MNIKQGIQGLELFEWEKLSNVEAHHRAQYMKMVLVLENSQSFFILTFGLMSNEMNRFCYSND